MCLANFSRRLGDFGVDNLPRKSKFAGSNPIAVDKFSECENRGHACHVITWLINNPSNHSIQVSEIRERGPPLDGSTNKLLSFWGSPSL